MVMVDYTMKMGVSHDVYSELSQCHYGLLTVLQSYTGHSRIGPQRRARGMEALHGNVEEEV